MVIRPTEDIYRSAGRMLRLARQEAGLSRDACAAAVGLSSGAVIFRYENGQRKIPLHLLAEFSRILGKDIPYFFLDPDSQVSATPLSGEGQPVAGPGLRGRPFDVLLAYRSPDQSFAEGIYAFLASKDLKVWFDGDQVAPGQWRAESLFGAVSSVKSAVVVAGPTAPGDWRVAELSGIAHRCLDEGIRVIPVLLPGVDAVPVRLSPLHEIVPVRFREHRDEPEAFARLELGVRALLAEIERTGGP